MQLGDVEPRFYFGFVVGEDRHGVHVQLKRRAKPLTSRTIAKRNG